MNCQRFEQVVSDLARSQMMEADVRGEALAHGEECERCAARLADEEKLTRALQFMSADMESLAAPDGLELKLREAFRQRHDVVPVAANSSRSRYWLLAIAAMLLVVMGVMGLWLSSNAPEKTVADNQPQKQVAAPSGPSGPTGPIEPEPQQTAERTENREPKRQAPKPVRRPTRRAPETQMANHASNEIATDFMPLGDANALVLQDGGQIIRVTLPRSTLVRFGFPVNMDRNENVKADVIVGVDGLARAIRFVQ